MFKLRKMLLLIGAVAIAGSCERGVVTPEETPADGVLLTAANSSTGGQEDPGLVMRAALEQMPQEEYLRLVEQSGNVVMVGFKQPGAERGVSRFGEPLVPDADKEAHIATVEAEFARRVIYPFKHIPAVAVRLPSPETSLVLRALPWVDYVAPSSDLVTPDAQASCAPISSPQVLPWHIQRVRADEAWSVATGDGAPKHLVLLDDGADEGGGWYDQELYWAVYSFYTPSTGDDGWHGTRVLGAAQARDNSVGTVGVAPTAVARVMKIFDPSDTQWEVYSESAIDDNATLASVMTISYSTKQTSPDPPPTFVGLHDAINNAYYQHEVLFTASTGNQERSDFYAYPARFDEVIGVGGSGHNDEYVLNNYAPGNVELAAPAVDVLTVCQGGDIGETDGTSFATPQVAATVMLLRELFPSISNDSLRARLVNSAVPMADTTRSGAGRLDVAAALEPSPDPPDPPSVEIDGPTQIQPDATCTWFSDVSGGTPPYSYYWTNDGQFVSSDPDYTGGKLGGSTKDYFDLKLTVTDAASASNSDEIRVNENESAPMCMT